MCDKCLLLWRLISFSQNIFERLYFDLCNPSFVHGFYFHITVTCLCSPVSQVFSPVHSLLSLYLLVFMILEYGFIQTDFVDSNKRFLFVAPSCSSILCSSTWFLLKTHMCIYVLDHCLGLSPLFLPLCVCFSNCSTCLGLVLSKIL